MCVDVPVFLESHKIVDRIEEQIKSEFSKPVNILIHIDPEKAKNNP